jgi:arylformamidase
MTNLYRDLPSVREIDAQYTVSPDPEHLAAARRRARDQSVHTRESLEHRSAVRYGPSADQYLNIFPARQTAKAPVFVFFHGGFWRALSAEDYDFVARGPVERGVLTVSVNYSLAPTVSIDEIVRQARTAVAWVHRNIADHGGDPNRIVVGGHSAGAQLAAMCALTDWPGEHGIDTPFIKRALLVSGIFDLTPLQYSYLQPQIRLDAGIVERNSPIHHVRPVGVPVLAAVGERETREFRRQTHDFYTAWSASNPACHRMIDDADHATALEPLLTPSSPLCDWIAAP